MTGNIICILIAIVVYLVGMVAIGVYYSKGQSDAHEFYLGGRKLGPIVTALSTEASDMSAYLLMGVPGLAFFCGIAEASWTAIGLALGTYLNWLLVAKRDVADFFSRTGSCRCKPFSRAAQKSRAGQSPHRGSPLGRQTIAPKSISA